MQTTKPSNNVSAPQYINPDANSPSQGKRASTFLKTEDGSPLKIQRTGFQSAMPVFQDVAMEDVCIHEHATQACFIESAYTPDSAVETAHNPSESLISESDWSLIYALNRNVFSLLTQVAFARQPDPLGLLNQQLENTYPGITLKENQQNSGAAVYISGEDILVRKDFLPRITQFSVEPDAQIARAVLADCIVCRLCDLYQTGRIFVAEIEHLKSASQSALLKSRNAMRERYHEAKALPMPDQFSALCVLEEIPL